MTYIENIFLCLAIPLILSLFFPRGKSQTFTLFVIIGMGISLLSAYVSSFCMVYYGATAAQTTVEITPVIEELMKLLPLLFFLLVFEPRPREVSAAALAIAVGFATFENVCYLTENGAANFTFLLIRGISAGALHILCGIFSGYGISYVFRRRWLAFTGTIAVLGVCSGIHGIYNLLISADGTWWIAGCIFPSVSIAVLLAAKHFLPKELHSIE